MASTSVWAIQALGDLELGLGRPAAAIEHYQAQADALRSRGIADVDLSPAPELVDACLRLGRDEDGRQRLPPISWRGQRQRANPGLWPAPPAVVGCS